MDGIKLGVYNLSSNGTVSMLLPTNIQSGNENIEQTSYMYEVSMPGYASAKGTVSGLNNSNNVTKYTWVEDSENKAEKIEISQTSGYEIYLAPATSGTKTIDFSVLSGDASNSVTIKDENGEIIEQSQKNQYSIQIPDEGESKYSYNIHSDGFVNIDGSFKIDNNGNITDLTDEGQKSKAISYSFSNTTFSLQLSPKVDMASLGEDKVIKLPNTIFEEGWYPGISKEGKFAIENNTSTNYVIEGYKINIKDKDGKYKINNIVRCANEAVCELYGWSGREESTLYGLIHIEEQIKKVYENNESYTNNYKFTYSDYLLYYFKTKYPSKYSNISSLSELDKEDRYKIFSQFNSTDDCFYDGGLGDSYGDIDIDLELKNKTIYSYQNGVKYAALELDKEVDEIAKEIAFDDGFLFSFDTEKTNIATAPSLYEWSIKSKNAQDSFNLFNKDISLNGNSTLYLNNIGFKLQGGAFSNSFMVIDWDYDISLIIKEKSDMETYGVEYEFKSGTEGKNLPQNILDLLPVDNNLYKYNDVVSAKSPSDIKIYVDDGVWIFNSYENEQISITTENLNKNGNIVFVGVWEFKSNEIINNNDNSNLEDNDKDNLHETKTNTPDTKDNSNIILFTLMFIISLIMVVSGISISSRNKA